MSNRPKDFSGTASVAAADDFILLDGATNSTRKLAAARLTRTLTGTAGQIAVANGDGVAGNPTLSLPTALTSVNSLTSAAASNLSLLTASSGLGMVLTSANGAATFTGGINAVTFRSTTTHESTATFNGGARILADGGSLALPGIGFTANTGIYYTGSNVVRFGANGAEVLNYSTVGLNVLSTTPSTFPTNGSAVFGGGIGVAGAVNAASLSATNAPTTQTGVYRKQDTDALRNALAPAQGLVFSGAASRFAQAAVPGAIIGTGPVTHAMMITVPVSTASMGGATQALFAISSGLNDNVGFSLNGMLRPTGLIELQLIAATNSANIRVLSTTANIVTLHGGKTVHLAVVRNGAAQPAIYLNGALLALSADSTAGSPPADWAGSITSTNWLIGNYGGGLGPAQTASGFYLFNRALTAAEVLSLYERAAPAAADYNTAGAALLTGDNSTFASDTGYWTKSGATINNAGNGRATIPSAAYILRTDFFLPYLGKRVWLTASIVSGSARFHPGDGIYTTLSSGVPVLFSVPTNSSYLAVSCGVDAITLVLESLTISTAGLLIAPAAQAPGNGFQWRDQSGNLADITLPATGVTWALPATLPQTVRFRTSTNGNQQILGQQALPANARITSWVVNRDATAATINLGNASAGAQFVSALVLGSGLNDITLLTRFCATNNLWVNSNSTAVLTHTISYEIAN